MVDRGWGGGLQKMFLEQIFCEHFIVFVAKATSWSIWKPRMERVTLLKLENENVFVLFGGCH